MSPAIGERRLVVADFPKLRCFSRGELERACQDGQIWNLDAGSVYALDAFAGLVMGTLGERLLPVVQFMPTQRRYQGRMIPTATWNTPDTLAHSSGSYHYIGRAFDLMFPKNSLATAWLTALRFSEFGGVGAYPYWRPDPGLHLDTRQVTKQGRRSLWWVTRTGEYRYATTEADIHEMLVAIAAAA